MTKDKQASANSNPKKINTKKIKTKKNPAIWVSLLAVIITLATCAICAVLIIDGLKFKQTEQNKNTLLQQQINALQQQQSQSVSRQQLRSLSDTLQEKLSHQQRQTTQQLAKIQLALKIAETKSQPQHQSHANFQQLRALSAKLTTAIIKQQLHTHGNIVDIVSQLNNVKQNLFALSPASQPAMTLVNALMTQVRELPKLNIEKSQQQLIALRKQLGTLSFKLTPMLEQNPIKHDQNNKHPLTWRQRLQHSWTQIKDLLVIHNDTSIGENLLNQQTRFQVLQSIELKLSEASWALFQYQQARYQQALDQAQALVTRYCRANQALSAWQQKLQQLRHSPIRYSLSAIDANLKQLNNLISALADSGQTGVQ